MKTQTRRDGGGRIHEVMNSWNPQFYRATPADRTP